MNLPDRIAFTIPGTEFAVYWYAILITLGIIAAVVIAGLCAKIRRMPKDTAIDLCLAAVPLGLIFARLYYVLFELESFTTFADIINVRSGGLAIPGGIIGGFLGVCIYSLIKKKRVMGYADIIAPGLALAQAIGRWGNFFNQEAYGVAVTNPKLLFFPFAVRIENCALDGCECTVAQHGHLATFFYESMFCLIIFAVLTFLTVRKKMKHNGDIFLVYALLYSLGRGVIEGFRTDSLMLGEHIRVTQLLCAVIFVTVVLIIVIRAILEKRAGHVLCAMDYDEYYIPDDSKNMEEVTAEEDLEHSDSDDDEDETEFFEDVEDGDGVHTDSEIENEDSTVTDTDSQD